jgi:hypothetical protein
LRRRGTTYRDLDEVLGLIALTGLVLSNCRRGKDTQYFLMGLLRQSVFGRLPGYRPRSGTFSGLARKAIARGMTSLVAGVGTDNNIIPMRERR